MWGWSSTFLYLVSIFCFILAAFKSTNDLGRSACIVAAISLVIHLIKLEVKE